MPSHPSIPQTLIGDFILPSCYWKAGLYVLQPALGDKPGHLQKSAKKYRHLVMSLLHCSHPSCSFIDCKKVYGTETCESSIKEINGFHNTLCQILQTIKLPSPNLRHHVCPANPPTLPRRMVWGALAVVISG
jgi:hypothetical protein